MTYSAPILPDDVSALQAMVRDKDAELHVRDLMIEKLKHQLAGQRQHRFGARSETADQLALGIEDREIGEMVTAPEPVTAVPEEKGKPKRSPLPPGLPRETETLPAGDACSACGGKLKRLGDDVTEKLEYVPRASDLLCIADLVHASEKGSCDDDIQGSSGRVAEGLRAA